jgi:alpha-ribazole phosphatase
MVTILYLIRHGETEGADKRRYKGSIDIPLSENGVKQMERVSEYMAEAVQMNSNIIDPKQSSNPPSPLPFLAGGKGGLLSAVYCSDLSRAIKSAEIIGAPYSLKPIVIPALRERNFGIWEGMSFDEIREKYPDEFDAWAGNPLKFSPMGGESTSEMTERVIKSFDEIIAAHAGKNIAVVSHGGVNRIILCHILGIPLENIFRIEQDYAALNIVEFWDRYPVVKLINGACDV